MKKRPLVHIMDDSCNYVRYYEHKYPEEGKLAYGSKRGCFEAPSDSKKPSGGLDCPDILPLTESARSVNPNAMMDPNPLVHPDSDSLIRYCLGTRIQMGKKNKSHKSPTCQYHDANLATQGRMLKTMTQESLQNCRKFRTIQVINSILFNLKRRILKK